MANKKTNTWVLVGIIFLIILLSYQTTLRREIEFDKIISPRLGRAGFQPIAEDQYELREGMYQIIVPKDYESLAPHLMADLKNCHNTLKGVFNVEVDSDTITWLYIISEERGSSALGSHLITTRLNKEAFDEWISEGFNCFSKEGTCCNIHEMTHLFVNDKIPVWVNEGIAEFMERTDYYEKVDIGVPIICKDDGFEFLGIFYSYLNLPEQLYDTVPTDLGATNGGYKTAACFWSIIERDFGTEKMYDILYTSLKNPYELTTLKIKNKNFFDIVTTKIDRSAQPFFEMVGVTEDEYKVFMHTYACKTESGRGKIKYWIDGQTVIPTIPYCPGNAACKTEEGFEEISDSKQQISLPWDELCVECKEGEKIYYQCGEEYKKDYWIKAECRSGEWKKDIIAWTACTCKDDDPCVGDHKCIDNECKPKPTFNPLIIIGFIGLVILFYYLWEKGPTRGLFKKY